MQAHFKVWQRSARVELARERVEAPARVQTVQVGEANDGQELIATFDCREFRSLVLQKNTYTST